MPATSVAPVPKLVGRDAEVAQVEAFLALAAAGPAALVIAGDPGAGKSVLLREVTKRAAAGGQRLLIARPREAETAQAYGALGDLLRAAFAEVSDVLPGPLRRALEGALLIASPDDGADSRLVATATAIVIERLSEQGPLLIAIDDAQWLDPDSARALAFALNRASGRLAVAIAIRQGEGGTDPLGLRRSFDPERLVTIVPSPLTLAAVHHLLRGSLGLELPRGTLLRVAEASGGNPLAALELGRAVADRGSSFLQEDPLPVPDRVRALVAARLEHLSTQAREVVLVVALAGRPTLELLERTLGRTFGDGLGEAETAGLLEEDGRVVRPSHPLVATVAEALATAAARREIHLRLASQATDPEVRARHLARLPTLSAEDEQAITQGAEVALARGAPASAARLFAVAARLTSPRGEAVAQARVREALAWLAAGDIALARAAADRALEAASPAARARVLTDLADIAWADGTMSRHAAQLREALKVAAADGSLVADANTALVAFGVTMQPAQAVQDADAALRLTDADADPARVGYLRIHRELASALAGTGVRWDDLEGGLELEAKGLRRGGGLSSPALVLFTMTDRVPEVLARFAIEDEWYAARGEDGWRAERRGQLAVAELRAGNVELAARLANEACLMLERVNVEEGWPLVYAWRSLVDAHRGALDRAQETIAALRTTVPEDAGIWRAIVESVSAFVAWASGAEDEALAAANRMRIVLDGVGVRDLIADRSEPFLAEIHAARGDRVAAHEELDRLERRHAALPRAWTALALVRTRAVVAALDDDLVTAAATLERSATEASTADLPFERAWNALQAGRMLRRIRERRRAAAALAEAKAGFERLGATPWLARVTDELARVGLRRGRAEDLTPTEIAIARLAATGLTTRQVAEAAFVSPKTVEANLTRIYRKLGIGSRAELGATIRQSDGGGGPAQT